MSELFEIIMLILFGASWPVNVYKSYKTRSAKGKSPVFLILIMVGYIAGLISKFCNTSFMENLDKKWYVLCFYILNFFMVGVDLTLYFRNKALDKKNNIK